MDWNWSILPILISSTFSSWPIAIILGNISLQKVLVGLKQNDFQVKIKNSLFGQNTYVCKKHYLLSAKLEKNVIVLSLEIIQLAFQIFSAFFVKKSLFWPQYWSVVMILHKRISKSIENQKSTYYCKENCPLHGYKLKMQLTFWWF